MGEIFRTSSPDPGLGVTSRLSELRIVLVCNDKQEKNWAVDTILGRTQASSNLDIKTEGEVEDRHVIIVSSPDWVEYSVQEPWKHVKQQIEESVSLCLPGPHAFFMLVPLRPFREAERREVEENLELLPECIWRRSIVLFSGEERLGGKTVEKHIEEETCLQQLIRRCRNQYNVLSNENREVILESIVTVITGNDFQHFQMKEFLEEVKENKERLEENAKQRLIKVQKQRETLKEMMMTKESGHGFPDTTMVLLGGFGAGKSSTGNTILGEKEFDTTRKVVECVKKQGEVGGRTVTVVETPGWHRDSSGQDETQCVKDQIRQSESLCAGKPHAFLLAVRCDSSFTETDRRRAEEHLSALSEEARKRTLVLFTRGDGLGGTDIETHIERWNELRGLVDECGNRYHVLDNNSTDRSQVEQLLEKVDEMDAEMREQTCQGHLGQPLRVEEEKPGDREQELQREEEKLRERQQAELEELEREFGQESGVAILEAAIQKLQNRLEGERGEHVRELEGELKRKQEQRAWVEKEERKRREENEMELRQRHKEEMEALRQRYREKARQGAEGYLNPILLVSGAIIGGVAGALIGPAGVAGGSVVKAAGGSITRAAGGSITRAAGGSVVGATGSGSIRGATINPVWVAGGIVVGATVGALGGMFGGWERSEEKGRSERRKSMDITMSL